MNFMQPPFKHLADELQRQIEEKHEAYEQLERARRLAPWIVSVLAEGDPQFAINHILFPLAERLGREVR